MKEILGRAQVFVTLFPQFMSQSPSRTPWSVNKERNPMPSSPWIRVLCICIQVFITWSLLCIHLLFPINLINIVHKNLLASKFDTLKKTDLLFKNLGSYSHHERAEFGPFWVYSLFISEPAERLQVPTLKVETGSISSEWCELAFQTHSLTRNLCGRACHSQLPQ